MSHKFSKNIFLSIFLLFINVVSGQTKIDSNAEFNKARTLAFSGKRAEARIILRNLLAAQPKNSDAQTLLARTYAWDKRYDSARIELNQVLSYSDKNEDATNALIDVELWSDNYKSALDISNKALKDINPRSEDFLLKKARALANLNNPKETLFTLQELLKINPKNAQALTAVEMARQELRLNKIGIQYDHDEFTSPFSPWNNISLYYDRTNQRLGSVIGRINSARRFDKSGTQYEIDIYPKLNKKIDTYFNFGYSRSDIFPKYRWGFSLYKGLPKGFEGELGMRYLKFSKSTFIYTGLLGKYVSDFLFSFRAYIIPREIGYAKTFVFITRHYLNESDNVKRPNNYLTLTLASGIAPDEFVRDITLLKDPYLRSKSARLAFQRRFWHKYIFSTAIGYARDEFLQNSFRENYNFSVGSELVF
jgi:YaiO family outer membrane protein